MAFYVVRGEDPNADAFGPHVEPVLGYFEGEYYDVLELAQSLPGWSSYGRGGKVEKITFQRVTKGTLTKRRELMQQRTLLQGELKKVQSQLEEVEKGLK